MYGLDTPYPKTALNGVSISVNKGTLCIMGLQVLVNNIDKYSINN
ncbi:MAG: hypothetical protein ACLRQF_09015 [Thomasclavelia ramosa]